MFLPFIIAWSFFIASIALLPTQVAEDDVNANDYIVSICCAAVAVFIAAQHDCNAQLHYKGPGRAAFFLGSTYTSTVAFVFLYNAMRENTKPQTSAIHKGLAFTLGVAATISTVYHTMCCLHDSRTVVVANHNIPTLLTGLTGQRTSNY